MVGQIGSTDAANWYVARTKPRKEREAAAALTGRGVEVYLPMLRKTRARTGRREWEPLFPCYLFARFEVPSYSWLAVRSAPYVAYFLGHAGLPSALPDGFVETLRIRLEQANRGGGPTPFRPGEQVVITQGPFRYLSAVFDRRLSASGRSRVLVQILRRLVPVELPEEYLRKAI